MLQDQLREKEKKKEEGEQQSAAVTFSPTLFSEGHSGYKKGSFKPKKNPTHQNQKPSCKKREKE